MMRTVYHRQLTRDDAVEAAAVLCEIYAGHEYAAEQIANRARLGDLTVTELEALCTFHFGDLTPAELALLSATYPEI